MEMQSNEKSTSSPEKHGGRKGSVVAMWSKDPDIDRGWAWIVMLAVALWNVLLAGTLKSFGVIYLEFEDLYQRGPVTTAWLGFSFSFLTTILAPFSGYFGDQVSLSTMRIVVMVLGSLTAIAVAATGWMPTLEGAIVTYGLAGLCVAVIDSPILSLLGTYFKKRRFAATGVGFAGSSLGTLIMPPLFTLLVDSYAIRGAMIVFGGMWLNTLVIGAVVRPLWSKRSRKPVVNRIQADGDTFHHDSMKSLRQQGNNEESKAMLVKETIDSKATQQIGSGPIICNKNGIPEGKEDNLNGLVSREGSVYSIDTLAPRVNDDVAKADHQMQCAERNDRNHTHNNRCQMLKDAEAANSGGKKLPMKSVGKSFVGVVKDYLDFLRTPGLPSMVLIFSCASFAYFNQFFLFPPYAQEIGMSRMWGAWLVSISNIVELCSRLLSGILVDRKLVNKSVLIQTSFLLSAVAGFAFSFCRDSRALMLYAAIFGLVGGIFVPLSIPMMVDIVSDRQVSSAAGLFPLFTGVGISLGPPLLGAIKAWTGSFVNSLRVCAGFYLLALIILLLSNHKTYQVCRKKTQSARRRPIFVEQEVDCRKEAPANHV